MTQDRPMTFSEHLGELRNRLLKVVGALALSFVVCWTFHERIFQLIARPVLRVLRTRGIAHLQALQVTETVMAHLQASLLGALVLATPVIAYQIWAFVAPGLYHREKRVVLPVVGLLTVFFALGVLFCYFVFLPLVVDYLVAFTQASGDVALLPTVQQTFRLTVIFLAVFGLVFELPLLMFFLSTLGVVSATRFWRFARYFVVLAFVLGAILTPPDPLSQALMALPLCALYLVGVAFAQAGDLLRRSGRTIGAAALAIGVFVGFVALIGTAAWYWSRPSGTAGLPALPETCLRLECRLDTPLGRACLAAVDAPPDTASGWAVVAAGPRGRLVGRTRFGPDDPCPGTRWEDFCLVQGVPQETLEEADGPTEVVRLRLEPPCLQGVWPDLPDSGNRVTVTWTETPTPLATVGVLVEGPGLSAWKALLEGSPDLPAGSSAEWLYLGPWDITSEGPDQLVATAVVLPNRARQVIREWMSRMASPGFHPVALEGEDR